MPYLTYVHGADTLSNFISKNRLITPHSRLLLAVSGGKDSVLMCHMLHALGYTFAIAHCNFQLRGAAADGDESFVKQLAHTYGAPFYVQRFNTKAYAAEHSISTQMAARQLRYTWFSGLMQQHNYNTLATAHHATDNVETVLLNMLRGTGIAGMAGMQPARGHIIRPLLCFSSADIARLINACKLQYRHDESNDHDDYKRNYLRHNVLPLLHSLNPALENTVARNSDKLHAQHQLLQAYLSQCTAAIMQHNSISLAGLARHAYNPALLQHMLQPYGFTFSQCADMAAALSAGPATGTQFTAAGGTLTVNRGQLLIQPAQAGDLPVPTMVIQPGDTGVTLPHGKILISQGLPPAKFNNNYWCYLNQAELAWPLSIRHWQQGDKMQPLGMKARVLVSDIFINAKVPQPLKQQVPVLTDALGNILWLAGLRSSALYTVTPHTAKVVILQYIIS